MTEAPAVVQLQFDNLIEPGLVKVRLKEAGTETEIGKGVLVGERTPRTGVEFTLPEHGAGSYLITWISFAFDGHIVSGTIPYTVDPNATSSGGNNAGTGTTEDGTAVPDPGSSNRIIDIVEIQLRFIGYLGMAALFGGIIWLLALRRGGEAANMLLGTAEKGLIGGAYLAGALSLSRGGLEVWRLFDGGYQLGEIWPQLANGHLSGYLAATGLFVAGGYLANKARLSGAGDNSEDSMGAASNRNSVLLVGAMGAFGSMILASLGHAAGQAAPGVGSVLMGAHLIAASIWVGGVGMVAYVATDTKFAKIEGKWTELKPSLDQLGRVFIVSFMVLAVSGIRAAYVYGEGMPEGTWGLTLVAKLAIVGGGGLIGLFHYVRGRQGRALSAKTLAVEAALLVLAMTAAAVLSTTVPA